jgi:hypothetical protein
MTQKNEFFAVSYKMHRCEQPGCYNLCKGRQLRCGRHAKKRGTFYKNPQLYYCEHPNCETVAHYVAPGTKTRQFCATHKPKGYQNPYERKSTFDFVEFCKKNAKFILSSSFDTALELLQESNCPKKRKKPHEEKKKSVKRRKLNKPDQKDKPCGHADNGYSAEDPDVKRSIEDPDVKQSVEYQNTQLHTTENEVQYETVEYANFFFATIRLAIA